MARGELEAWSAARGGDSRAFSLLFDRHYDRVFRHVVGLVDQGADADEVCGSAFLELWRLRDRVQLVHGSVLPWLLVTAGNLARNHGRKTRRYQRLLQSLPRDLDAVDAAVIAEEQTDLDRRASALRVALGRLKPVDAQLVDLTTRADLPVQDAAVLLGLSAAAARVRLHRARRRLRDLLPPEFDPSNPNEAI